MKPPKKLEINDFIDNDEVKKCIEKLKAAFENKSFIVSDVLDEDGNQYVNLVQKGGGVLGVALVGYTYILEQMGIRFLRLAGTSAGAINTALMTVIKEKQDTKSIEILKIITELNFFNLVDGHPVIRKLIKNFITNEDFGTVASRWIKRLLWAGIILLLIDFVFLGLRNLYSWTIPAMQLSFMVTGIYFLLIGFLVYYSTRILNRVKTSGFGLNPGNYFYDWIKAQLVAQGVNTVQDLTDKASHLPKLKVREGNPESADSLFGDVTIIASELVTENKIEFPSMCHLFREKDQINTLQPAGFIRASMSIPIFFESYFINRIPNQSPDIKTSWENVFNEPKPPVMTRFVDGGILSNFPISIFYNSNIKVPRLPSFGIDLDDSDPQNERKNPYYWSIGGYLGHIFNTTRFYYDKDFLLKNKVYNNGIGKIKLPDFNWLNFFLKDEQKVELFVRGAKAATEFLLKFDWEKYKEDRVGMQVQLKGQ